MREWEQWTMGVQGACGRGSAPHRAGWTPWLAQTGPAYGWAEASRVGPPPRRGQVSSAGTCQSPMMHLYNCPQCGWGRHLQAPWSVLRPLRVHTQLACAAKQGETWH